MVFQKLKKHSFLERLTLVIKITEPFIRVEKEKRENIKRKTNAKLKENITKKEKTNKKKKRHKKKEKHNVDKYK